MSENRFDTEYYGRLLTALRHVRGFRSAKAFAVAVSDAGVPISERSMWAIEGGHQIAGVDRHLAFCRVLGPEAGYFEQALG